MNCVFSDNYDKCVEDEKTKVLEYENGRLKAIKQDCNYINLNAVIDDTVPIFTLKIKNLIFHNEECSNPNNFEITNKYIFMQDLIDYYYMARNDRLCHDHLTWIEKVEVFSNNNMKITVGHEYGS